MLCGEKPRLTGDGYGLVRGLAEWFWRKWCREIFSDTGDKFVCHTSTVQGIDCLLPIDSLLVFAIASTDPEPHNFSLFVLGGSVAVVSPFQKPNFQVLFMFWFKRKQQRPCFVKNLGHEIALGEVRYNKEKAFVCFIERNRVCWLCLVLVGGFAEIELPICFLEHNVESSCAAFVVALKWDD